MLVYRICTEEEIQTIFQEMSFEKIGKKYSINDKINTHQYEKDKKYIHFFSNYLDTFFKNSSNKNYICTYDIQEDVLNQFAGTGYYLDRDVYQFTEEVREYAIEADKIHYKDLKMIDLITEDIDFEDLIDNTYQNKIVNIYNTLELEKEKVKRK